VKGPQTTAGIAPGANTTETATTGQAVHGSADKIIGISPYIITFVALLGIFFTL
jgi:hypothetical protein